MKGFSGKDRLGLIMLALIVVAILSTGLLLKYFNTPPVPARDVEIEILSPETGSEDTLDKPEKNRTKKKYSKKRSKKSKSSHRSSTKKATETVAFRDPFSDTIPTE